MDNRFRKIERLRKREEFRNVLRKRRLDGTYLILHALPTEEAVSRLGVIVSRAVGNAVTRNRVKRRLREVFRCIKNDLSGRVSIVIRAKPKSRSASYWDLAEEIEFLLRRLRLLKRDAAAESAQCPNPSGEKRQERV